MIISFKNINGGGGGYVLPTATPKRLGGVKIGQGINVDSAGTISVSGIDVANYAMALKNTFEEENNLKVINDNGFLYMVEQERENEDGIYVKTKQNIGAVDINIDLSGQTAPEGETIDIVSFGDVTIALDEFGELFYFNGEENIYFDGEVSDYQYGDFSFNWYDDGKHISFNQNATNFIEATPETGNYDRLYEIAEDLFMANQNTLGLVKIGEGINLAEDGTISVEGGSGIEVVSQLPASGTDGQVVIYNNRAYIWDVDSNTCEVTHIAKVGEPTIDVVTYFGELPEGEAIFRQWHPYWNTYFYLAFDGEEIISYREPELINETYPSDFATLNEIKKQDGQDAEIRTFTEGMIVCTHNLDWTLEVYGNWADAGNGHWKPLDYDEIKNNALQAAEKNNYTRLIAPDYFDITFANIGHKSGYKFIYVPTNGGQKGMFLQASGNEQAPVWTELNPVKVLDTLPAYANEGDVFILSPLSETDNGSFVSIDSTSDPNNFDFDNELGHSGDGEYLCFVNDGYDYSNVPNKTLIAVIQMRTDESSEWNNDHIEEAYLYFNSEDDGTGNWVQYYSLEYDFMKTIEGQPVQFSGDYTVDDNNTTVDSDWLNIWNDSYGYKFNLEYVEGATQNYLYFRSVYSSGEGEDSGDLNVRIHYYTKQFKTGVSENCEPSEFYIFKNGIWIKLGKTEEPQV